MSRVILDEDSIDSEKCPVWQQHGSSEQFSVMKCDSRTDLVSFLETSFGFCKINSLISYIS